MKEDRHAHPVDFPRSILTMSEFWLTCEAITHSGYFSSILIGWRRQLLDCAEKDHKKGREKLATLWKTVANLLDHDASYHRNGHAHNIHLEELGEGIGKLRYDVMLRVAHKLYLGEEIERIILRMLLLSLKPMEHEFKRNPMKIDIGQYKNRLLAS